MVGYNFHPMFEPQIVDLTKRQTVRAERKRHALPGERMQLFCDQRSRRCRKLLLVDPICVSVQRIEIYVTDQVDELIASISIDGIPLHRDEIEAFALDDGFAPERVPDSRACTGTAREIMGLFWRDRHGCGRFEGVLVKWEPA